MPSYDHPSAAVSQTPGGFSLRSVNVPSRNYKITEQNVTIDVDLENREISGATTIIVAPTDPLIKFVRLDCRQLSIESVLVNGKRAHYTYNDLLKSEYDAFTSDERTGPLINDIHQYHLYKGKTPQLHRGENTEELTIFMPDNLKLYPQDPSNIPGFTPHGHTNTPGSQRAGTKVATDMLYTNVKLRIEYSLKNPSTGLRFIGGKGSPLPKNEWYAYTSNTSLGISTSSWVPCIDSLWDKCSWTLDIGVPKTVKQIGMTRLIGALDHEIGEVEDDDEEDESTEISVIVGDFAGMKETAHPVDLSKKSVVIDLYNPTSAHHIGFVVGPFIQAPLINLQDDEATKEKDTSTVPSAVYCMPHQTQDALNTTIFVHKALDFFSKEFGSYPNASCALVFINDLEVDYNGFCGFSLLNDRLLYSLADIDPLFDNTFKLLVSLAEQWSGIYVVPATYNDLWITVGIAHYMAFQFIKDLMGLNEFKYRVKKQAELICDLDVGREPLSNPKLSCPISSKDLAFIRLKAPIVLFILDKRMTKQSFGLSRVFPKIFLQCMSGDLPNGSLTSHHFQHVCEKVNHNRLESFFRQWVHGSGVPIFAVSQRFNKKRMFIEMSIRQVQGQETVTPQPQGDTFIDDAVHEIETQNHQKTKGHQLFTGPMTIRIHEADGTPYEHIVDIKEGSTKLDIQYNTKYKRLKRSQKQIKSEKEAKEAAEEDDQVLLHCLGDILQTPEEINAWRLTDWNKEQEDKMTNEAFEWIRIDADFEWICKIFLVQPDYMYASQLQQDRDVEAQLESISYFANSQSSALYSTILLRTLMDSRYYYGIRVEAALGLSKLAKRETGWNAKLHLFLAFKNSYCFENSDIPLPNDFSDFPSYFVKKAIPEALSQIKDPDGRCPLDVKQFLLSILQYNQNLSNQFSDVHYVGHLIKCLTSSILSNPVPLTDLAIDERKFLQDAIGEISRQQKMDEWTVKSSISVVALRQKMRLLQRKLLSITPEDLLERTNDKHPAEIRIAAFEGLFQMGALKNASILKYFFLSLVFERSAYLQDGFVQAFIRGLGNAVVNGGSNDLDEDELTKEIDIDAELLEEEDSGMVVIEEDGNKEAFESRRDAQSRTTLNGTIELLRRHYGEYEPLKNELWSAVRHPLLSLCQKRSLFDIIAVVYPAYDTLPVTLKIPRDKIIKASRSGAFDIVLKRQGHLKISLPNLPLPQSKTSVVVTNRRKSVSIAEPQLPAPHIVKLKKEKKRSGRVCKSTIRRNGKDPLRFVKLDLRSNHVILSSAPLRIKKVKLAMPSWRLRGIADGTHRVDLNAPIAPSRSVPLSQSVPPVKTEPAAKPKLKLKFKF